MFRYLGGCPVENKKKFLFLLAKLTKEGKPEQCKPITKVEWKSSRSG